ncbi:hypothetical protein NMY22_g8097 [Coprinellus aureogranulatus]|nr:hypothetical protein NMY22_g8097 [Coprinellus aureogranulatus]
MINRSQERSVFLSAGVRCSWEFGKRMVIKKTRTNGFLQGQTFKRVIGIGHSFGSVTLDNVAQKYGNLLNATIITGLTSHTESNLPALATWSSSIASENAPDRLGGLGSEYTIWNNIINNQQNFFAYPNYDPAILQLSEATKYGATLGEWLTMAAPPAPAYTNPVMIVTGDKDYVTCTAKCLMLTEDGLNLVEATKELFPSVDASKFATNIPENTGHGVNAHLNAQETYSKIQEWIATLD